jgi:hypothetical protein
MRPFCYRRILQATSERSPEVCARCSICALRHHFPDCPARFTGVITALQRLPGATESSLIPSTHHRINRQRRHRQTQRIQNP